MVTKPWWARATDAELFRLEFRELELDVAGSKMQARVERLYEELEGRGLSFRPHVWLSHNWFAAEGVPGIAIPFYLAHPRLERLERRLMKEAEGGSEAQSMQLLRHECGHAIDFAYRIHHRKDWRATFGPFSTPYRMRYRARPGDPDFVTHLPRWYAQSHPSEDWAETFAVWLSPPRRRFRGRAREKLAYVDERMRAVAKRRPAVRNKERTEALGQLPGTLGEHYKRKKRRYASDVAPFRRELVRLLPRDGKRGAVAALRALRPELRRLVDADPYSLDQVLGGMIHLARDLDLGLPPRRKPRATDFAPLMQRTLDRIRRGPTLLHR